MFLIVHDRPLNSSQVGGSGLHWEYFYFVSRS